MNRLGEEMLKAGSLRARPVSPSPCCAGCRLVFDCLTGGGGGWSGHCVVFGGLREGRVREF